MKEATYFQKRMNEIGVTKENGTQKVIDAEAEYPSPSSFNTEIFSTDEEGNINILITRVNREIITYYTNTKLPKPRQYVVTRLINPSGDMKYKMPAGQGTRPFFPPVLQQKFEDGSKIDKLYLTEGAFKAMAGSIVGMDIVGLSSITHYAGQDGKLHHDIALLIEKCQVQTVCILWDGDCLDISVKDLNRREDISRRPNGFYKAAKRIRELVRTMKFKKTREAPHVYFMHVKSDCFHDKPKGLDDLLLCARTHKDKKKVASIVKDAKKIDKEGMFFYKRNITKSTSLLVKYFGLDDLDIFYNKHADKIENTEFTFKGDLYKWNEYSEKLEVLAPNWAKEMFWIGDEYFVERTVPSAKMVRRSLLKRNKSTLEDRYGKDFQKYLTFYEGFCNVPAHFDYQRVIETESGNKYLNRYFPFKHTPEEGKFPYITKFLKHIFGTHTIEHGRTKKKYKGYQLGLDYIQMLLLDPTQLLPVLCLYSPENATGKSTLGKFLMALFGDNVVQISNSDLQSEFNELYVDKLLAICEETLLERKKDVEKIKALSTSDVISVNPKGQKKYMIDSFVKFQFYSNNKRLIYITKNDDRFWILKINKPKQDIPNLLARMKAEIPAFIHYLKNRQLATDNESRMWFHFSLIQTDAFLEAVKVNEPQAATDLREAIREMFLQDPNLKTVWMPMSSIKEEFFSSKTSDKWIQEILKDYVEVDLLRDTSGKAIVKRGEYTKYEYDSMAQDILKVTKPFRGRPYVFERNKFVTDDEVQYLIDNLPNTAVKNGQAVPLTDDDLVTDQPF